MTNVFKILISALLLSALLTVASVAQPANFGASTMASLQDKGKGKEPERPVEREKKDDRRDERRDDKKDDKKKKPDEQS